MAFVLDLSPTYRYPVVVRFLDEAGKRVERTFHAHFRRLKRSEVRELLARAEKGEVEDRELLARILADWEGIEDAAGKPIPCTPETIAEIAEIPEVAAAIAAAWAESLTEGARKNS